MFFLEEGGYFAIQTNIKIYNIKIVKVDTGFSQFILKIIYFLNCGSFRFINYKEPCLFEIVCGLLFVIHERKSIIYYFFDYQNGRSCLTVYNVKKVNSAEPVSYTHLDVYKRQHLNL